MLLAVFIGFYIGLHNLIDLSYIYNFIGNSIYPNEILNNLDNTKLLLNKYQYAGVSAISLFLTPLLMITQTPKPRVYRLLLMVLCIIGILVGIITLNLYAKIICVLIVALIFNFIAILGFFKVKKIRIITLISFISLLITSFILFNYTNITDGIHTNNEYKLRVESFNKAYNEISDNLIIGKGPNNFTYTQKLKNEEIVHTHSHNNYLQIALDSGIIGLLIIILIDIIAIIKLITMLFRIRENFSKLFILSLIGAFFSNLVYGLTDYTIFGSASGNLYWFLLGIISILPIISFDEQKK